MITVTIIIELIAGKDQITNGTILIKMVILELVGFLSMINGITVNSNGEMAHDIQIDGKYYVRSDGSMYVNTTTPDGKKVDQTGMIVNKNSKNTYSATFELGRDNGKSVLLPDSDNSGSLVIYNKVS